MKRFTLILILLTLGLIIELPRVRADTATPTPTRTRVKICQACNEDVLLTPTPKPVVNFWLFYGSHCADCIKLLNNILPPILAKYEPDQVVVYKYDLEKGDPEIKTALERWHGLTQGDVPEIFIGEYALLGNQQIQAKLGALIDDYLARGGVELLRPNLVATPTPPPIRTPTPPRSAGVVRAVLFWSATCPHCHQVINNVLPPLQQKYGERLDIRMFELSDPAALELFEAMLDALHVPPEQWGVPFMIVGDEVLVGSLEIPERLPRLIEKHLAEGGIGWPAIPGLEKFVSVPTTIPAFTTPPAVRVVVNDTPIPPISAPAKPVVRAVMFWMNGCPHCEQVIKQVLPPLEQKYGEQLDIRLVEVKTAQDVDELYRLGAMFGFSKEQTGVPFLIIANRALVGSEQIPAELPGLIDELLATGGADLPNIAGLDPTRMTKATTSPTCPLTMPDCGTTASPLQTILRQDPVGFALAMIAILGMVAALCRTGFIVMSNSKPISVAMPTWQTIAVPVLLVLGLGVAGYLAYVEVREVSAICGPVGDCNTVQQSPYARLFGILPIGILGVLGYLALLAAWFVGQIGRGEFAAWGRRAAFAFATFGVVFSLYLTFLEPFVIGAVCAWCLTSAVIMTALMWLLTRPALQSL